MKYNLFVNGKKQFSANCPEQFVEGVFLYREMLKHSRQRVANVKHVETDLLFTVMPKRRVYLPITTKKAKVVYGDFN